MEPCFQLFEINDLGQFEKSQQVYLSDKEGETLSAIRNTVILNAENLGFVLIYEAKSGKDQELDICKSVYEIATHNIRRVCVKIKKYSVNRPHFIHVWLFTAKENEAMKQVAYVNYTFNEIVELSQKYNCKPKSGFVMFRMFGNWNIIGSELFFLTEVYI